MSEVMALGPWTLAALALVVFVGALVQRLAGQGFGMLVAPTLALLAPDFLPASILVIGFVMGIGGMAMDRDAIALRELSPGFAGRTLGAAVAALIALRIHDTHLFGPLVALLVYAGIALSLAGLRVAIRPSTLFTAGLAAGIMGTLTGIGAPPMAILYQHEPQRRSAAMQNTFFLFGTVVSMVALFAAGLLGARHLALSAVLVWPALAAVAASKPLGRRLARARMRPVALGLAGVAASVLLARSIFGAAGAG